MTDQKDQSFQLTVEEQKEFNRRQILRNWAILFALVGLSIIIYLLALIKL